MRVRFEEQIQLGPDHCIAFRSKMGKKRKMTIFLNKKPFSVIGSVFPVRKIIKRIYFRADAGNDCISPWELIPGSVWPCFSISSTISMASFAALQSESLGFAALIASNNGTNFLGKNQKNSALNKHCIIPLCWVTFCIHPDIIPVGQYSRKCAKSINQSINRA